MVATSAAELRASAKAVRARLFAPANAVVDRGIDLLAAKRAAPPPAPPPAPAPSIDPQPIVWIPHKVRVSDVVQLVADYYCVDMERAMSPERTVCVAHVRRVSVWLAHEVLGRGYSEIARAINRRSHQGVMRGVGKVYADMRLDGGLAYDVAELERRVEALSALLIAARAAPCGRKRTTNTISQVIEITADHYKIPIDHVLGSSRIARIAKARHVACYLARSVLGQSLPVIGRVIGRDHTTVFWACSRISERLQTETELFYDIELLKQRVLNNNRGGA